MFKKIAILITSFTVVGIIGFVLGPTPQFEAIDNVPVRIDLNISELDTFIGARESEIQFLKPDNQARIIWYDSLAKQTEYSIVYIHGFSASQAEGKPIHMNLARAIGANLYLSRLQDHGIDDKESFKNLTPKQLVEDAKKAIAIGKIIGKKVIVMSCSTGSTLSIYLAAGDPEISSLILMSPNIAINSETAKLITGHWGKAITQLSLGEYRVMRRSDETSKYWTESYHTNGLIALQNLIDQSMTTDVFSKITVPVYVGYFYKSEEEQDHVVSVEAMLDFKKSISSDTSVIEFDAFSDAGEHVIGSSIKNPNWLHVQNEIFDFVRSDLGISLDSTAHLIKR